MIRYSESTKSLFTALQKFQGEVESIKKDATNPHFKSKYAKLEDCIGATRPALQANDLVVVQPTSFIDGMVVLHTRVTHTKSGEWMESEWPLIPAKNDPQGMGSANTYGRRYNYLGCLGLDAEDDDGNDASKRHAPPPQQQQPQRTQAPLRAISHPQREEIPHPVDEHMPDRPEDLDDSAGQYVVTFGGHKGKTIAQMGMDRALQYAGWLRGEAIKKGQPLSPGAQQFVLHAEAFSKGVSVQKLEIDNIPFG